MFDNFSVSDYAGRLTYRIGSTMLLGNTMNMNITATGSLYSNGVPYQFRSSVIATATKLY